MGAFHRLLLRKASKKKYQTMDKLNIVLIIAKSKKYRFLFNLISYLRFKSLALQCTSSYFIRNNLFNDLNKRDFIG